MIRVQVVITGPLKKNYGSKLIFDVRDGATLGELLSDSMKDLLSGGSLRSDLLYLLNGVDAAVKGGGKAQLLDGDVLTIVPIAHGG
ncbi:MAG: hypothetical protein ACP5TI_03845 [Thermoprotei archaeon]